MELDSVPQPALDQIERVQGADLVVGVLRPSDNGRPAALAEMVREALEALPQNPRGVLVVDDSSGASRMENEQSLPILFCKLSAAASPAIATQSIVGAYRTIFSISHRIGGRACTVIASELQSVTPMWINQLARPALELEFDLVVPRYARHKWGGLINRGILSPLNRALYGKRIHNPLGPDFGFSGKLVKSILE